MRKNLPTMGDTKSVHKFLWVPLILQTCDGVTQRRWLERATICYVYHECRKRGNAWVPTRWLNT